MPRSEEEIRSDIERADEDYTEAYLPEAATYYDYGIYDSMADLLHTPAGGTHLNVCSGPFYIEEAIQRAHPEVAIAGIDLNREMLMAAQRVLTQLRANYRTHINGTLNFSSFLVNEYDEPLFHWSYPKDFKDIPDFLTPGGPIEMIQGDVTEESLIQAILMGRQLDSASFSFLGSSPTNLMEATAQISALDEEEHYKKRVNQHWQSI
ncbi:hypothetical protein HON58_02945, partial [Candidatus Peregrinibacteria bacterium]|nr:hypothetical protein [Candidatus Peregrinibacteria bacterium]